MKTTYIYCPRCARVHERMPERRVGQDHHAGRAAQAQEGGRR